MASVSRKVLVVAAHPDDEVLGCGGTIARHTALGDEVSVMIVAEGITSRSPENKRAAATRDLAGLSAAATAANKALGVQRLDLLAFPDNRLDSVDLLDLIRCVEAEIALWRPEIVYTHHAGDVNVDHCILNDAVVAACRPQPGHCVRTLLFYEVASSTEWRPAASRTPFAPDWFVDISAHWATKRRALEAYASEMRPAPHPRSVDALEHLAGWRGASVGCAYAEAFMLGRHIES